jgi:hypothetical protein
MAQKIYQWVAYSHDDSFEDDGRLIFAGEKECYNAMRNAVLNKMTWNTEYSEDFPDAGTTIGYRLIFKKNMIVHKSYSGVYVYVIYTGKEKPTYNEVFSEETISELRSIGFLERYEVEEIENIKRRKSKSVYILSEETDWWFDIIGGKYTNIYAQNYATRLFENTSYTRDMIAVLFDGGKDEEDIISDCPDPTKIDFLLFDEQHHLVGYVYTPRKLS